MKKDKLIEKGKRRYPPLICLGSIETVSTAVPDRAGKEESYIQKEMEKNLVKASLEEIRRKETWRWKSQFSCTTIWTLSNIMKR